MSKKTKTNFISASVKKVRSLTLLVTGGVVMSSMALALLLQDTASSNNENVQVWGVQSRVQYLTEMTLSWANNNHIKFKYNKDTNSLNLNAAVNLHALILGSSNTGVAGATVIGGHDNKVQGDWQNAAIIGGSNNTTNDTTSSIIAGSKGSSITKAGESAIFSAQGTIVGGEDPTDTVFIVWGQNHSTANASTVFIAGAEGIKTTKSHNVLIGKNIRSNQSNIFVWSNGNTELTPQKGSAFYVNSTSGFGLNTNNPQAALDISNGGLAFNKVYQLSDLADVKEPWVILMVAKDGKQGICAYNGTTWVPLSLNAEREGLCTASTQSTPPKHATSTISGAVQFSGQPVITNGTTLLHQVWSGGMNNNHGGWINHPWTYKHTGTLNDGEYRCGIGYHMGNPTPDGMKNTDCKACSPITNQRDWRSNGKNNDCEFSCKAGFKKVGRSCDTCEVGTYTTDGTVANSCASCTNKPANSHYISNGTSATSCSWACDAGYHNVGWACKKAVWKSTVTPTCKAYPGKWKDALKVTTYSCALQEDPSVAVPEHICAHWSAKPANQTVAFADENCNPPEWETNRTCPQPACNLSRLPGKCGGNVSENVTCIKHKRDRAGYSYDTQNENQSKSCTRTCEVGACGYPSASKTQPASYSLCSLGSASTVGTAPVWAETHWTWSCSRLDGLANCNVKQLPPDPGRCGSVHNVLASSLSSSSYGLCAYGAVAGFSEDAALYTNRWSWTCKGDAWAVDANCIAHKPAPQAGKCAQELNKCDVGNSKNQQQIDHGKRWECEWLHGWSTDTTCSLCDNGYIYNSATNRCDPKCGAGFTPSNGKCVKWKCETISLSSLPARCVSRSMITKEEYDNDLKVKIGGERRECNDPRRSIVLHPHDPYSQQVADKCRQIEKPMFFFEPKCSEKKTQDQCEKDFDVVKNSGLPSETKVCEWLKEWQTPSQLIECPEWAICWPQQWPPWHSSQETPRQEFHYEWALYERWVDAQWRPCEDVDKERKCRRKIINEEGLEVQEPGPRLPIHWIAIEQGPPRPTGMKVAKCVDEQSNIIADELCKTVGSKPSCQQPPHNPPTPPPPGPPKLSKINGQCKAYPWTYASQPATNTTNGCLAGEYQDIPDAASWGWKCNGRNGGTSVECSATKKENPPSPRPGGGGWCNPPCPTWYRCENHYARTQDPGHKYHGGRCVRVAPPHPWPWPHPSQPWDNRRG